MMIDPATLSGLVSLGAAGAVIYVVIVFLKFISEQRKEDRSSLTDLVNEIKGLTQELVALRKDFDRAVTMIRERTKPRPRKDTNVD